MSRSWLALVTIVMLVWGCGSAPSPKPSAPQAAPSTASAPPEPEEQASPASEPLELESSSAALPPGRYTRTGFLPRITLELGDGWFAGTLSDGFFDVQQERGTPDVIAVQFGRVGTVVGGDGTAAPADSAEVSIETIKANPKLDVLAESESTIDGVAGFNVEVENASGSHASILSVPLGALGIDSGRRLWISLFDTQNGVLAVMVGGSSAQWERALEVAEPVLESVTIGEGNAAAGSTVEPVRVALGGRGPIGLAIADDHAWVVLTDSGDLVEVDLASATVARTIAIGTGGSQVVAAEDRTIYVGRFDTGGVGEHVVVVAAASGEVSGIEVGPVGGLAVEGPALWALLRTGAVTLVDRATGQVRGSRTVHVDSDSHMDSVAGAGSVWVSGDRTPVHRIAGPQPHVVADIETGGGIPLAFADGLVWGASAETLWAIDPATNDVSRRIPLSAVDEILAMDVDADRQEAWIAIRRPGRIGSVIAVDLASEAVVQEIPASLPAGIRLTADRAWVTDYDTNELIGIPRG